MGAKVVNFCYRCKFWRLFNIGDVKISVSGSGLLRAEAGEIDDEYAV